MSRRDTEWTGKGTGQCIGVPSSTGGALSARTWGEKRETLTEWLTEPVSRPRLLDLFCGAGGAGMGYHRAGFEVVGVDIALQPRYPFEFHQGDALEFLATHGHEFDAIHASPPCQAYTPLGALHPDKTYPDLVAATRAALDESGKPYVIENVMAAPLLKQRSIVLCGGMFGLRTYRHRRFESRLSLTTPEHPRHITRTATKRRRELWDRGWHVSVTGDVGTYVGPEAMGIDWMNGNELCQAIPPAYTEFIGRRVRAVLATTVGQSTELVLGGGQG